MLARLAGTAAGWLREDRLARPVPARRDYVYGDRPYPTGYVVFLDFRSDVRRRNS
jgi:hypothetical protein